MMLSTTTRRPEENEIQPLLVLPVLLCWVCSVMDWEILYVNVPKHLDDPQQNTNKQEEQKRISNRVGLLYLIQSPDLISFEV